MGMREVRSYPHPENARHTVHVYEMGDGGAGAELHVAVQPDLRAASQGAGGVHHVAFRTPDAEYDGWAERLTKLRVPNSGKVDRFWFRSLYFREPNGILFEIASDGPGFGVDEPMDKLGEKLVLPPFLEGRRKEIEKGLKALCNLPAPRGDTSLAQSGISTAIGTRSTLASCFQTAVVPRREPFSSAEIVLWPILVFISPRYICVIPRHSRMTRNGFSPRTMASATSPGNSISSPAASAALLRATIRAVPSSSLFAPFARLTNTS